MQVPVGGVGRIYTHAEVHRWNGAELGPSREYNIDLAPRVVHCAGSLINALLDAGAQNYLEFKLLQQSYVWREGRYVRVPASRADIFKDRSLSPLDKRALMRFLQNAQQSFLAQGSSLDGPDAERPFVETLRAEGLGQSLRDVIMYALACIPSSQEGPELTGCPVSTADGMAALARYMESVGRYGADTAAFLVPLYGGGELPQAFCRVAAVAGALYVLRQPVADVTITSSPGGGRVCTGVTTGSGQALAAAPGLLEELLSADSALPAGESAAGIDDSADESAQQCHSQAVAILDQPLQEEESQVLVVIPPGAVCNTHPVYALQVGSATACAPPGRQVILLTKFLLYLSTPSKAPTAAEDLRPSLEALVNMRGLSCGSASTSASSKEEPSAADFRPKALLAAYYNSAASSSASALQHLPANIALCDPPDATIGYEAVIQGAQALLQRLFPDLQGGLFPGGGDAGDDESDEEAIQALSEALGDLGVPTDGPDKAG
ncbi:FAD/NAD(P)-binding domain-containing protein [Coccomyxa subellipsoidea C-169]|uniref:FAD/NAD(P)-binding domain-containing protein n=1 Tax=Coccomyxa subellipsoidea (strain C-169) TaxID=574566 RepID=I0Z320_COCSC|nr:FAD/NAD(P)-binding domain-containing protein [Coccomyxa subellipsoidea C-169]EIE25039.1 FAD/NAD(P)-binding domain-containing protein [Coccomyxa subellipsoidea C-169]|eukprot:XP_005649583.1 FAD/NAD(P)-binding domain-containing protein [Coccomyxa subellipsoidea C-169]